jgi:ATP-dependent protease ClpP protease subunit
MSRGGLRRAAVPAFIVASVVLPGAAYVVYAPRGVAQGQPALVRLEARSLVDLRSAFNAASAGTRLLVLLSPT